MVQQFLDDTNETLTLPKSITAAERDQIRQICKHFDLPFKVHGDGSEKFMVIRKPDYSYFEAAEHEQQAVFAIEKSEIGRLKQLVFRLSNDVNIERIKINAIMHKLHSEPEREAAMNEINFIESEMRGLCSVCATREIVKMSDACGHSCCTECFDVARCPLCEKEVEHVIFIPTEMKPEGDAPSNPTRKRIRS